MKLKRFFILAILISFGAILAAQLKIEDIRFPLGVEINSDSFVGQVYIQPMKKLDNTYNFPSTNNIIFAPAARSSWHSHGAMILIVTGGAGYYQEEGKNAQIIRRGDVIEIEEGTFHWHGALPNSWLSQIVIYNSDYISARDEIEVDDEYYFSLVGEEYSDDRNSGEELMFARRIGPLSLDTFSNPIFLSSIVSSDNILNITELHYVVFSLGAYTNWHSHQGGQILIATDGVGFSSN